MSDRVKIIKVGIIVADENEFMSILKYSGFGIEFYKDKYFEYDRIGFEFVSGMRVVHADFVLSGIGLTNAAGLAGVMIADRYDCILNAGLSGAISSVSRNDTVICDRYNEHDFDLTKLGYKPGIKGSGAASEYSADPALKEHFIKYIPGARVGGAVAGNSFIADAKRKNWIKTTFSPLCCDMESAGIAAVCDKNKIPFLAVRRISDTADDVAENDYSSYSVDMTAPLFDSIITAIVGMAGEDVFWEKASVAQFDF